MRRPTAAWTLLALALLLCGERLLIAALAAGGGSCSGGRCCCAGPRRASEPCRMVAACGCGESHGSSAVLAAARPALLPVATTCPPPAPSLDPVAVTARRVLAAPPAPPDRPPRRDRVLA